MNHRIARCALGFVFFTASMLAADITGIWAGQQQGRLGQPEDVAFRFKMDGQKLTGTMFGDEFDIPIGDASISGDQIRFMVTNKNYYSKNATSFVYTGTIKGPEMELVRERVPNPEDKAPAKGPGKQTLKLKRL